MRGETDREDPVGSCLGVRRWPRRCGGCKPLPQRREPTSRVLLFCCLLRGSESGFQKI